MAGILAVETATDACSVALSIDGHIEERHEIVPRQHNQRLFQMLRELLPEGDLRRHGISALAYGSGPGSFTGLRIAASAVQGLAYASELPVVPVPSLAVVAQSALSMGLVQPGETLLATIDARVDELYGAIYEYRQGLASLCEGPWVSSPAHLPEAAYSCQIAAGSGCRYVDKFPQHWRAQQQARCFPDVLPRARDMISLAEAALERGDTQNARQVNPVYVQEGVSWKKLHEQGKQR